MEFDLNEKAVLHVSGSHSSGLCRLSGRKASIGCCTVAKLFATVEQAIANPPGFFTYEGDESLLEGITALVTEFQGIPESTALPEAKVFTVGAVIVSNYLVALAGWGQVLAALWFFRRGSPGSPAPADERHP